MDTAAYAVELIGTEGRLFWKSSGAWILAQPHFIPDGVRDDWQPLAPVVPESWQSGMRASVDDYCFADEYLRALDEGREHECSGAEGVHTLEVMMGIFESAAYGRRVDLPQAQRDHPLLRWRAEHGLPAPEPRPRGYGEWLEVEDRRLDRVEGRGRY
jgi:predicted dehydrogenase